MSGLEKEIGIIQALRENAESVSGEVTRKLNDLQKRIQQGETTGDKIRDLVIARYGFISNELEEVYRGLQNRIQQHSDEFVLVVVKNETFHGCTGFGYIPKPQDYVLEENLYLGVLKGNSIIMDISQGECGFPTANYARCWDPYHKETDIVVKNLDTGWFRDLGLSLNKPLECKDPQAKLREEPDFELEVKIGDKEVGAWFNKQRGAHYLVVFQKMAQILDRPIPES